MALGSVMKDRIRNFPPHSQRRGSVLKTLRIKFAQRLRRAARSVEESFGSWDEPGAFFSGEAAWSLRPRALRRARAFEE
jgi:hypothetical protein